MRTFVLGLSLALLFVTARSVAAEGEAMACHKTHAKTEHEHGGKDCKHKKVKHADHFDYVDGDQYHAAHEDHYDNHGTVTDKKADAATTDESLKVATHEHVHGPKCGHKAVKHGNHTDYDHDGNLHATHLDHVDEHGSAKM